MSIFDVYTVFIKNKVKSLSKFADMTLRFVLSLQSVGRSVVCSFVRSFVHLFDES